MRPITPVIPTDDERLSQLAMRFRSTRQDDERRKIASEYAETVERLIKNGHWDEMPPPEDQLPDAWMPPTFFDFWSSPQSGVDVVPSDAQQRCGLKCHSEEGENAKTGMLTDEERLGQFAFQFRGTRRDDERRKIAGEYAETVEALIKSGHWDEMPPPEDQLPDGYMPQAFFDFWLGPPSRP